MVDRAYADHLRRAVWRDRQSASTCGEVFLPAERIRRLESALESCLEQPVSLPEAAYALGFEVTYCCKLFQAVTGSSFSRWIRRIRIEAAKEYLRTTNLPIDIVSSRVGYSDTRTFQRNFRKHVGTCAREYRRTERERACEPTHRGSENTRFAARYPISAAK